MLAWVAGQRLAARLASPVNGRRHGAGPPPLALLQHSSGRTVGASSSNRAWIFVAHDAPLITMKAICFYIIVAESLECLVDESLEYIGKVLASVLRSASQGSSASVRRRAPHRTSNSRRRFDLQWR